MKPRRSTTHPPRRQRGGIYILTLATALFVTSIGIAAISASRLQTQRSTHQGRAVEARQHAMAGLEVGLQQFNRGLNRPNRSDHGRWRRLLTTGDGVLDLRWADPIHQSFDQAEPSVLRLSARHTGDHAGQALGIELVPAPVKQSRSVFSGNGDFETDTTDWAGWPTSTALEFSRSRVDEDSANRSLRLFNREGPWSGVYTKLDPSGWPAYATIEVQLSVYQNDDDVDNDDELDDLLCGLALQTSGPVANPFIVQPLPAGAAGTWVRHRVLFQVPWADTVHAARLIIQTSQHNRPFYVDRVSAALVTTSSKHHPRPLTLRRILLDGS